MSDPKRSVDLVRHGPVRQIVLNAPERRNALDRPMLDELAAAIADVARDQEASVLVVSGAGQAFCAGADVSSLFGDPGRPVAVIRDELKSVYASFLGLHELTIPAIASVHGVAVGAGVNIALACDVVIMGPSGRFVVSFADIGLHPGGGCSWFLSRRLGAGRAMAVILGGQTIEAEQAVALGLAVELAEDAEATALALAAQYAARDKALLRDMKRAVQLAQSGDLSSALEFESWAQASSVTGPRFRAYLSDFGRRSDPAGGRSSPPARAPAPADVVRGFYAAITEHDPERLGELAATAFAEDIAVELPPSLPYGGRVQGAGRLRRMFQAMARGPAETGPRDLAVEAIVDGGDRVTARLSFTYRRPDGTDIATEALEEWTFEQGRAVAIRAYYRDTAALLPPAEPIGTAGPPIPAPPAGGGTG